MFTFFHLDTITLLLVFAVLVIKTILALTVRKKNILTYLLCSWFIFAAILLGGIKFIKYVEFSAKYYMQADMRVLAQAFSTTIQTLNYENIKPETKNSDPFYRQFVSLFTVWQDCFKDDIARICTFRENEKGQSCFVICPNNDYNQDGKIEGANEYEIENGRVYAAGAAEHREAYQGRNAFKGNPEPDEWGFWVTANEPVYAKDGSIIGILGVYRRGDQWNNSVFQARLVPQTFLLLLFTLYFVVDMFVTNRKTFEARLTSYTRNLEHVVDVLVVSKHNAESSAQAKNFFLTSMSRNIRSPLNKIVSYAEEINGKQDGSNNETGNDAAQLRQAARELSIGIDDFLVFANLDSPQVTLETVPVNLRALIEDVRGGLETKIACKPNIRWVTDYDDSVPQLILGDPTRLRQIFDNLITNAITFTEQGSISVRASVLEQKDILDKTNGVAAMSKYHQPSFRSMMRSVGVSDAIDAVFASPQTLSSIMESAEGKPMLRVDVTDTGIGLSQEQIDRVFRPFTQPNLLLYRQQSGAGLGIVRGVTQLMGGMMLVQSEVGKGSTFSIYIPCLLPGEAVAGSSSHKMRQKKKSDPLLLLCNLRILVVDDMVVEQLVTAAKLHEAGAAVDTASNGQIAVERVLSADKSGKGYDVVLMDVHMPIMDGITAAAELRSQKFGKPIIAVAANAAAYAADNFTAVLEKPFNTVELFQTVLAVTSRTADLVRDS